MDKRETVDQKLAALFAFMELHERTLSRQGSIVASWRDYKGSRLGPYYRLTCRVEGKKQVSHYLGKDERVIAAARSRLSDIQHDVRSERITRRRISQLRGQLRKYKLEWKRQLAAVGLTLKGYEIRGWRRTAVSVLLEQGDNDA